jgi:hypothetical protein
MVPNSACSFCITHDKKQEVWVFGTLSEAKETLKALLQHSPEVSRKTISSFGHDLYETITCEDNTTIRLPIIKGGRFSDIEQSPDKRQDPKKKEYTPNRSKEIHKLKTASLQSTKQEVQDLVDLHAIVQDLNITPKRARRLLKRGGIHKPVVGWSWPQGKPVEDIKKCLIDLISKYPQKGEETDDTEADVISDS